MTLTQALKENMGDPERRTCTVLDATSPEEEKKIGRPHKRPSSQAFRKSD